MLSTVAHSNINEIMLEGISSHESEEVKSAMIEELEILFSHQALQDESNINGLMEKIDSIEVEVDQTATPREIGKEIANNIFEEMLE